MAVKVHLKISCIAKVNEDHGKKCKQACIYTSYMYASYMLAAFTSYRHCDFPHQMMQIYTLIMTTTCECERFVLGFKTLFFLNHLLVLIETMELSFFSIHVHV